MIIPLTIAILLFVLVLFAFIVSIISLGMSISDNGVSASFEFVFPLVCTIVSALLLVLTIFCAFGPYGEPNPEDFTLTESTPLYAVGSGDGVHGHFVFGCGTINDIQYYIGYTNVKDDSYMQVKYDASNTILRLNDTESPRADTYSVWMTYPTLIPFVSIDEGRTDVNVIYIPTDGLSNTYSIN